MRSLRYSSILILAAVPLLTSSVASAQRFGGIRAGLSRVTSSVRERIGGAREHLGNAGTFYRNAAKDQRQVVGAIVAGNKHGNQSHHRGQRIEAGNKEMLRAGKALVFKSSRGSGGSSLMATFRAKVNTARIKLTHRVDNARARVGNAKEQLGEAKSFYKKAASHERKVVGGLVGGDKVGKERNFRRRDIKAANTRVKEATKILVGNRIYRAPGKAKVALGDVASKAKTALGNGTVKAKSALGSLGKQMKLALSSKAPAPTKAQRARVNALP